MTNGNTTHTDTHAAFIVSTVLLLNLAFIKYRPSKMYIASVDCRNQRSRASFWSSAMLLSLLAAFHFALFIITLIKNQSHTDCGKQKTGAQDSLKVIKFCDKRSDCERIILPLMLLKFY